MDLKAPLLPTKNDLFVLQNSQVPKSMYRKCLHHPVTEWTSRILKIILFIWFVYFYWPQLSAIWNSKGGPQMGSSASKPVHHNPNLNYTKRELVHLDIEVPAYGPIISSLSITESLSICHYSYSWNATGTIKLARGDPEQQYNFMIGMDVAGSSQQAIDSIVWRIDSEHNAMYVRCVEFPSIHDTNAEWDATIRVDMTVFIKPHTLQFGEFSIGTDILDIEIDEGLSFETYHMSIYSTRGNIHGKETEEFTAHEISAISTNGSITGNWSLPSQIELRTGGWNSLDRPIDIDLIPKMWSFGPSTQGILSATTQGGDIDIRMPLKDNLSLRNMSINIYSQFGSISGTFVTGYTTSLSTLSGSIDATLLPYFALQEVSTLVTSTAAGHTKVRVLPPVIDSYYHVNPLKNTKSEHSTTSGALKLRYPRQWVGAALGLSETGSVGIEGDRFNTIVQEDHMVVARTDNKIASRLDFSTTTGDGYLVVE
jgi:hypothetical protein